MGERGISPERLAQLRQEMGLDQPLWRQFLDYVYALLHGDFGRGLASGTESGTCRFSRRRPLDLSSTPFLDFVGELSKAVMFDLR